MSFPKGCHKLVKFSHFRVGEGFATVAGFVSPEITTVDGAETYLNKYYYGISLCAPGDVFSPRRGREDAFKRIFTKTSIHKKLGSTFFSGSTYVCNGGMSHRDFSQEIMRSVILIGVQAKRLPMWLNSSVIEIEPYDKWLERTREARLAAAAERKLAKQEARSK